MTLEALLQRAATFSAFEGDRRLLTDPDLETVLLAARQALAAGSARSVTLFHDATGRQTELELEGPLEAVRARLGLLEPAGPQRTPSSREVALLPRHWNWAERQPGGCSAALRRLVDQSRRDDRAREAARVAREAADHALTALAGDLPGFEEVLRALYRGQFARVEGLSASWPADLRAHLLRLVGIAADAQELARGSDFSHCIYVAASPSRVWQALTDPELTRAYWGGRQVESDWQLESPVNFRKQDGQLDTVRARVVQIEPVHRLVLDWAYQPEPGAALSPASRLTYQLDPTEPDEVRLTVTQAVHEPGSVVDAALRDCWPLILSSLKSFLETGRALRWIQEGR